MSNPNPRPRFLPGLTFEWRADVDPQTRLDSESTYDRITLIRTVTHGGSDWFVMRTYSDGTVETGTITTEALAYYYDIDNPITDTQENQMTVEADLPEDISDEGPELEHRLARLGGRTQDQDPIPGEWNPAHIADLTMILLRADAEAERQGWCSEYDRHRRDFTVGLRINPDLLPPLRRHRTSTISEISAVPIAAMGLREMRLAAHVGVVRTNDDHALCVVYEGAPFANARWPRLVTLDNGHVAVALAADEQALDVGDEIIEHYHLEYNPPPDWREHAVNRTAATVTDDHRHDVRLLAAQIGNVARHRAASTRELWEAAVRELNEVLCVPISADAEPPGTYRTVRAVFERTLDSDVINLPADVQVVRSEPPRVCRPRANNPYISNGSWRYLVLFDDGTLGIAQTAVQINQRIAVQPREARTRVRG